MCVPPFLLCMRFGDHIHLIQSYQVQDIKPTHNNTKLQSGMDISRMHLKLFDADSTKMLKQHSDEMPLYE